MELLSRRSAMLAVPVATAGAALAATETVAVAEPNIMTFTCRRTKSTLPNLPPVAPALGTTFISYLSIVDKDGKNLGDGSSMARSSTSFRKFRRNWCARRT